MPWYTCNHRTKGVMQSFFFVHPESAHPLWMLAPELHQSRLVLDMTNEYHWTDEEDPERVGFKVLVGDTQEVPGIITRSACVMTGATPCSPTLVLWMPLSAMGHSAPDAHPHDAAPHASGGGDRYHIVGYRIELCGSRPRYVIGHEYELYCSQHRWGCPMATYSETMRSVAVRSTATRPIGAMETQ